MKILTRYVLREHVGPLFFALSALTTLLLLNQVAKQFGNLVGKGLSWGVIGEFFLLTLPFIIAMTLPMAVLVAVLYAFSKLSAENEVTALRASGVSMIGLIRPVLVAGVLVAAANLLFNDQVLPRANHRLRSLQTDIARKKPTFALRPQVINEVIGGRLFLRAGMMDEATDEMREVTIFNFDDPTNRKTIYADSGRMNLSPDQRDLVLTLHHGYMQQIPQTNMAELERLYFGTDFVRIRNVGNKFEETEKDTYKSEREMSVCEMDSMFQTAHHEEDVARHELAATMHAAVHLAATGEPPTFDKAPAQVRAITLGSLYCQLVKRISPKVEASDAPDSMPAALSRPPAPPPSPLKAPPTAAPPKAPPSAAHTTPPRAPAKAPPQTIAKAPPRLPGNAPLHGPTSVQRVQPANSRPPLPTRPGPAQPPSAATAHTLIVTNLDLDEGTRAAAAGAQAFAQTLPRLQIARSRVTDARLTASRYATEIQKKFALAAACAVFVLLGAPVGLRFPRGGVGMVLGVSVVVFGLYYIGLVAGEAAADRLVLSPFWGMWMTNVLCTVIGTVLMVRVQRSGATARGGEWHEMLEGVRVWWIQRRPRGHAAAPEAT